MPSNCTLFTLCPLGNPLLQVFGGERPYPLKLNAIV